MRTYLRDTHTPICIASHIDTFQKQNNRPSTITSAIPLYISSTILTNTNAQITDEARLRAQEDYMKEIQVI